MPKEINLLPQKNRGFLEEERTIMLARAVAILSALFVVSCLVGVFILGQQHSLDSVQQQQAHVQSQLVQVKDKANTNIQLVDRANHIQTILKTRSLLGPTIETLQSKLPKDVTMQSLSVTTTAVSLSVSSSSLSSLKSFLDALTAMAEKKKIFKKLTINNIVVNAQTGTYVVNVQGTTL
jgi:Tfp pilus assembly protein PilN